MKYVESKNGTGRVFVKGDAGEIVGGPYRSMDEAKEKYPIVRVVETWPRLPNGMVPQQSGDDADLRRKEIHRREALASEQNYADETAGVAKTYDPEGRYNCGRCNKAYEGKCLVVVQSDGKTPIRVDLEAGSCRLWERICAGDPEAWRSYVSIAGAGYAVAANGVGWSCGRCWKGSKADQPDDMDRGLFCGIGNCRVDGRGCCNANGLEAVLIDKDGNRVAR